MYLLRSDRLDGKTEKTMWRTACCHTRAATVDQHSENVAGGTTGDQVVMGIQSGYEGRELPDCVHERRNAFPDMKLQQIKVGASPVRI